MQADGEDLSARAPVPQSYAFLGGLYLPKALGAERFDLRLEYATTRGRSNDPYVWYTHGIYTSYTYKGNIIGHHVGTDSDDFFTEVSYLIPEKNGRVFLSYDQEEHNLSMPGDHEKLYEVIGGLKTSLSNRLDLTAQYGYGKIKNMGNIAQETMTEQLIEAEIRLRF
jgi:predicted porin